MKADLLGHRFGDLVVIAAAPTARKRARWLCQCDCGKQCVVTATNLVWKHTKSCGCHRAPFGGSHNSPTYHIWSGIISRCTSSLSSRYANYGGRGITVCSRWLTYENFLADMGAQPPGLWLERIDNDRGYEPGNCRWATRGEQQRNKRSNRFLTIDGKRITLAEASERYGVRAGTIRKRLVELGWPDEVAISPNDGRLKPGIPLRGSVQ